MHQYLLTSSPLACVHSNTHPTSLFPIPPYSGHGSSSSGLMNVCLRSFTLLRRLPQKWAPRPGLEALEIGFLPPEGHLGQPLGGPGLCETKPGLPSPGPWLGINHRSWLGNMRWGSLVDQWEAPSLWEPWCMAWLHTYRFDSYWTPAFTTIIARPQGSYVYSGQAVPNHMNNIWLRKLSAIKRWFIWFGHDHAENECLQYVHLQYHL